MDQIAKDPKAHQKVMLFTSLTRFALSNGIALIFAWERMRDPSGGISEEQYQSFGFPEAFCACIYCGRSLLSSEDDKEFGQSHAHRKCRDDAWVNGEEPTYLPSNKNRPPIIFFRGTCPGSIDNAIVRVAWGIGMHFLLSRYPPASLENLENLDREVQSYGMAVVSDFLEGQEELAKLASSQKE